MTDVKTATDLFCLAGKVALVTGASSGLGRRFAHTLAAHGACVVAAARRTDRLETLCEEITASGGVAASVPLDVSDRESIGAAFDAAQAVFGPVAILVNNAGLAIQKPVLDMSEADWRGVLDVNLDGAWHVAQEAARRMAAGGSGGSIINIASILGLRVAKSLSAYCVSKAAVIQLTKAMAIELAKDGVRVNAIAPGYVLTEMNHEFFTSPEAEPFIRMIPQRRIADPAELDGVLLLLASDASSFMTGSVVTVDGGHSLGV
jgi:3-oxoacyl-[acyl-carrier protein] reductase